MVVLAQGALPYFGRCRALGPRNQAAICADLGYRPSDLVQANATIWVENHQTAYTCGTGLASSTRIRPARAGA